MFEDYDTYEFYENDLEEMGRNEAFEDSLYENEYDYPDFEMEDQFLDSFFESQYEVEYDY